MQKHIVVGLLLVLLSFSAQAFEVKLVADAHETNKVNVVAKNISSVYGADILIGFDPQFFDVADQDDKKNGTQISKGNFFAEGAYLLDNRIDLRKGEIHYATGLVRPMEDASGDGIIASFILKAKKSGATSVELKSAQFGTQEGELHKAKPMKLSIVADASGQFVAEVKATQSIDSGLAVSTETLLMIVIAVLLLIVIILLLRKK